jgi:hypothetical protein
MFIVAQLPFGDFRPLVAGGMGRLTIPDWTSDNLDSGFVRGFGKISPRNGSSFGLGGERAFADMDRAVRFVEHIELQQEGWDLPLRISPWFHRLYFDGYMSGRFGGQSRGVCAVCMVVVGLALCWRGIGRGSGGSRGIGKGVWRAEGLSARKALRGALILLLPALLLTFKRV